jgi:predicted  nucleic acid-binding Zn-ribbon protein
VDIKERFRKLEEQIERLQRQNAEMQIQIEEMRARHDTTRHLVIEQSKDLFYLSDKINKH